MPATGADWALVLVAVALFGYGVWRLVDRGVSLFGFGAIALGLTILPYRAAGLLGGLAFVALGVRECVLFQTVTLMGGVLIVAGALSLIERMRRDGGD